MFIKYNDGAVFNCNNFDICVVDGIYDEDDTIQGYGVFFVRRNGEKTDAVCVYECIDESKTIGKLHTDAKAMCENIVSCWMDGTPLFKIYDNSPVDEPMFSLYGLDNNGE